ncbi:MAG: DUF3568 family protein [Smithella sp.]
MKKNVIFLFLLMATILGGCNAAVNMNGKVMGLSSGQFTYQDGNLIRSYKADLDRVWKACEKTVKELNGTNIQNDRKIATGTINSTVQDEKVSISMEYIDKTTTSVAVFVGVAGNNMASKLIHEKIARFLVEP